QLGIPLDGITDATNQPQQIVSSGVTAIMVPKNRLCVVCRAAAKKWQLDRYKSIFFGFDLCG
ncbi:MAG: hypothetical protein ABSF60_15955, partial [Verrucomicrobiota bacterium]